MRITFQKLSVCSCARNLFLFFIVAILFASCSIQKRHYLKGYHLEHRKAAANNYPLVATTKKGWANALIAEPSRAVACDTLVFLDNKRLAVKIIAMGVFKISYKNCDNPEGGIFTVKRSSLHSIIFRNGSSELMKAEKAKQVDLRPSEKSNATLVLSKDCCVVIVRKNGARIQAKILSYGRDEMEYTYCDNSLEGSIKLETMFISKIIPDGTNTDIKPQLDKGSKPDKGKHGGALLAVLIALFCLGIIVILGGIWFLLYSLFFGI